MNSQSRAEMVELGWEGGKGSAVKGLGYQGKELRVYSPPPPFLFHYLQSRCPGPVKGGGREGR